MYCGEEVKFQCEEHGIFIRFPENETKKEITTTVASLNISSYECELPDDAELVSAVYQIHVSEALSSPVDVEIQHCIHLSNPDEAISMSFVRFDLEKGPPYRFTDIKGGQFEPNTRYGKIELCSFSFIGLLKRLLSPVIYATNVFRKSIGRGKYEVHIVVTKDLKQNITVSVIEHYY